MNAFIQQGGTARSREKLRRTNRSSAVADAIPEGDEDMSSDGEVAVATAATTAAAGATVAVELTVKVEATLLLSRASWTGRRPRFRG